MAKPVLFSIFAAFSIVMVLPLANAEQTAGMDASAIMYEHTCNDASCSKIEYVSASIADFPPPLKQIRSGQSPSSVTCTEGLELVLKQSNGLPACIKPSSVSKLIERGWAIHILPDYSPNNTNSEIFKEGQYQTTSEYVNYFESSNGYLARPIADGSFPAVVMIHEWWGLTDKLASHGYVVLAVDLYGRTAATSEEARQLVSSFDPKQGIQNMNAAVSYLDENYSPQKIGSIGWCFGGGQSLNLALNNDKLDATVIYYGSLTTDAESLSSISWPVLGIFAELDKSIPVDKVNEFDSALTELGIPHEIHIYPGVDHAFANPSGERYAPDAAQDAWLKTLEFLRSSLK